MFKIKNFKERKTMENKNVNELDIIELARELGKKLQKEDAFIKYRLAKQTADEDPELQRLLNEFDIKRTELSEEASKDDKEKSMDRIQSISRDMNKIYAAIMCNERMINYNDAKDAYDVILNRINAIIQKSSDGEDPETADYTPSCTGSCATCGGCG